MPETIINHPFFRIALVVGFALLLIGAITSILFVPVMLGIEWYSQAHGGTIWMDIVTGLTAVTVFGTTTAMCILVWYLVYLILGRK